MAPTAERPPAHGLERVEQQMAAVEQRHRQEVREAERQRNDRGELDEGDEAERRCAMRHARDVDRTGQLIRRDPPRRDPKLHSRR